MKGQRWLIVTGIVLVVLGSATTRAAEVTLAKNGKATGVIVVPKNTMEWENSEQHLEARRAGYEAAELQTRRQLLRDSLRDLTRYLAKMSGAEFEIVQATAVAGDKRTPIYIGAAARKVFGPVGVSYYDRFGFRVVADRRGIGLYGEAQYGTSYAIYELLHRLGCRWFMPSEMGECIPEKPTLAFPSTDDKIAPASAYRRLQGRVADKDFQRRNRMGGLGIASHHGLERYYISRQQREEHPEWRLHVNGKPYRNSLRWTNKEVAEAVADSIIERLDQQYHTSITLSPADRVVPTEDPVEREHDPEPRVNRCIRTSFPLSPPSISTGTTR